MKETILVLDFGGQYKELIARTVRQLNVYSEIIKGSTSAEEIKKIAPIGIILTGGPNSVYLDESPKCDPAIFDLGVPVFGICYGMQLMCHTLGGVVKRGNKSEYGRIKCKFDSSSTLLANSPANGSVLMSHVDSVVELPEGFVSVASTKICKNSAVENVEKGMYATQFHPEVEHTDYGKEIFKHFLFDVCKAKGDYLLNDYLEKQITAIREQVGSHKVILGLSGGVDSSVCAAILSKAIPNQLYCVFVDHGLMRYKEGDQIESIFSKMDLNFIRVNAKDRFLSKLAGISDPETKRKTIGLEFAKVFEDEAKKLGEVGFLAQGTIYPDVIESGVLGAVIKSHHNVGGLPKELEFLGVVEPLRGLFKDEVRIIGRQLGLPDFLVDRQPFPGPGLAIRIIGDITEEKIDILQRADHIICEEIGKCKKPPKQYFGVFTGINAVGVQGDFRTYQYVLAVRAVETNDFMTCNYSELSHKVLGKISSRLVNEIKEINRVVYDITGKPPSTVEWE